VKMTTIIGIAVIGVISVLFLSWACIVRPTNGGTEPPPDWKIPPPPS
jgi:hypothetical protein